MIKIFHIADLHLGLHFNNHAEAKERLSQARYETLENLVTEANEREAHVFAIAGDLFDRTRMSVGDIQRAVGAVRQFEGNVVLVLPGNHDYYTDDSDLWGRFSREVEGAGSNVLVLTKKEPVDLEDFGLDAVVWPAPCHAKHSSEHAVGWVQGQEKAAGKIHIGMAHGSIEGVSPDFDQRYFPMTVRELEGSGVDIWLMGHTHITWPEKPGDRDKVFNPGTPEPDGFDCRHEGRAFLHTIDANKTINTDILSTGSYRFQKMEVSLNHSTDIDRLLNQFRAGDNPGSNREVGDSPGDNREAGQHKKTVLALSVSGRLEPELYERWREGRQQIRNAVLELKLDEAKLREKITEEQIRTEFTTGSFPEQLLSSFSEDQADELQLAYELIREVRP